jgi:hypothetical protein
MVQGQEGLDIAGDFKVSRSDLAKSGECAGAWNLEELAGRFLSLGGKLEKIG